MIDIDALEFGYPRGGFRMRIEHFQVGAGEKVAVTGASGAGKTTLLNLIAGIVTPAQGTVRVAGDTVSAMSDAERRAFRITRIGFVFQDFELIEYLSVLDNILHAYRISRSIRLVRFSRLIVKGTAP